MREKIIIVFICILFRGSLLFAQKPVLDVGSFTNWERVDNTCSITNDGRYALYFYGTSAPRSPRTLMIQSLNADWSLQISNAGMASFTADSKQVIYIKGRDSMAIQQLGSSSVRYIAPVGYYQMMKIDGREMLLYKTNTDQKQLQLLETQSGKEWKIDGAQEYTISENGKSIVITDAEKHLKWMNLPGGEAQPVAEGDISNIVFDDAGEQVAFVKKDNGNKSFWVYKKGTGGAVLVADSKTAGRDPALELGGITSFTHDGGRLFITLNEKPGPNPPANGIMVDVWSYTDVKMQPQQLNELYPRNYLAICALKNGSILQLQKGNETVNWKTDDFVSMDLLEGDETEDYWNKQVQRNAWLVSTADGSRKMIPRPVTSSLQLLSPGGKYFVNNALDFRGINLYVYDFESGKLINVTEKMPIPHSDNMTGNFMYEGLFDKSRKGVKFAGWFENNESILVYDNYDIWKADPLGKKPMVCLTNGYGRKHNITFRFSGGGWQGVIIPAGGSLLINALDHNNKQNGFCRINLDKPSADPVFLNMGPYLYEAPDIGADGMAPLKARDEEVYLVKRCSAKESPNYFWTKDFKTFTPVSNIHPESAYNWMTTELHTFQTLDGRKEQGILYKPENFEPSKKYPVIFNYYIQRSDLLNTFEKPGVTNGGDIDIAWFVSHGYLVFTPDIHFIPGKQGQSVCNSVVAAANYLSKFPWVNAKALALQGHSFGGYETYYLATHSNLFAAVISSAGSSDLISEYAIDWGGWGAGASKQYMTEVAIMRTGKSLWETPDAYIENSPIFYADKITAPILMVANKNDRNVFWGQGIELFKALRRMGKRSWMLQYDRGIHGQRGQENIDYVLRSTQFFDHYLKGEPAPVWMTKGIPAAKKGTDAGFDLDPGTKTPVAGGLLTPQQLQKINALKNRNPVTVTFK